MAAGTTKQQRAAEEARAAEAINKDQPKNLDAAILAIMAECPYLKRTGKVAVGQSYTYASDADVIAKVRPWMLLYGVSMVPVEQELLYSEQYPSQKGSLYHRVGIAVTYRVCHAGSGTTLLIKSSGEGADQGDKSLAKAQTSAQKYALRQLFLIQTGDDPDEQPSSEQTRAAQPVQANGSQQQARPQEAGSHSQQTSQPAAQPPTSEMFEKAVDAIRAAPSMDKLLQYRAAYMSRGFSVDQVKSLEAEYRNRDKDIRAWLEKKKQAANNN